MRTKREIRGKGCWFFFSHTTNCLMDVNLSLIWCSKFFGYYNFSSVSCRKSHWLCRCPGLHRSCETLISATQPSTAAGLADACSGVSSQQAPPAALTTVELSSFWRWDCCAAPWVAFNGLHLFPLPSLNLRRLCHLGVWELELSCDFVIVNLGLETRLSIILFLVSMSFTCALQGLVCGVLAAKWFMNYGI